MSEGLNRVMLLGNVGNEPELRFTQGGVGVLSLSLATNETYLDRDKQRQERVEWHRVVVWGKRGEALAKFVKKGFGLFIEGSIRTQKYADREGVERYKTEIIANNVIVTRGDSQGEQRGAGQHRESHASNYAPRGGYGAPQQQQRQAPAQEPPPDDFGYDDGDQIPF